jgi:catechol 2,3-dioxygenase-like lactoylglutathione lyase family enzyme
VLHHVEIYVSNLSVTRAFWSELLAQIGYSVTADFGDGFTLSAGKDAYLTFVQVADKHAPRKYHRSGVGLNHLAFKVSGRERVDALRQFCFERRYRCLYDDNYPFANGGTDYYALYVEDPDRIKIEFVAT